VLWERNVSIAANQFMAVPIRNFVLTSAGMNRDTNNFVRNVHGLLRKNRRILADLYNDGKYTIHKDALFALGYNFNFFTHIIETSEGKKYQYCFEYGYREAEGDFIELMYNSRYLNYQ